MPNPRIILQSSRDIDGMGPTSWEIPPQVEEESFRSHVPTSFRLNALLNNMSPVLVFALFTLSMLFGSSHSTIQAVVWRGLLARSRWRRWDRCSNDMTINLDWPMMECGPVSRSLLFCDSISSKRRKIWKRHQSEPFSPSIFIWPSLPAVEKPVTDKEHELETRSFNRKAVLD